MSAPVCKCPNPATVRADGLKCATCRKPIEKREQSAPVRAKLPPEKADALKEIHNLRREFNAKLDRLKADILKA
jgi:hypothetical protein